MNPFRTTSTGSTFAGAAISVAIAAASVVALFGSDQQNAIGREVAVPIHLEDGQEFSTPVDALLKHGKLLFEAVWTDQEGGGRPLTKGTGRPLTDPSQPLRGLRRGCPSHPCGISGGR